MQGLLSMPAHLDIQYRCTVDGIESLDDKYCFFDFQQASILDADG